jgi:hypothetical protein
MPDDDLTRIDGVARIRIEDHIRECATRYKDLREAMADFRGMVQEDVRELRDSIAEARKTRFTLLMAVAVAAISGVMQIVLHFVPAHTL